MTVDLDDTARCPLAGRCESCGGADDLAIATVETPVGVSCATVCARCTRADKVPRPTGWVVAIERVMAHCGHLGIDVDQMAAAMEADRDGGTAR